MKGYVLVSIVPLALTVFACAPAPVSQQPVTETPREATYSMMSTATPTTTPPLISTPTDTPMPTLRHIPTATRTATPVLPTATLPASMPTHIPMPTLIHIPTATRTPTPVLPTATLPAQEILVPEFVWRTDFEDGVAQFNGSGVDHYAENENSYYEIVEDPTGSGRGRVRRAIIEGPPPRIAATGNGDVHRAYPDVYWNFIPDRLGANLIYGLIQLDFGQP